MWVRKESNRQGLDFFSDSGQLAPQFILIQTLAGHIHRPESVCLHHLGEIKEGVLAGK
jgi:hypothetical protein